MSELPSVCVIGAGVSGHFDLYTGPAFEKAVADQLYFLGRHVQARAPRRVAA